MAKSMSHESLQSNTQVEVGSEKSFGIVFAVVFAIIGSLSLLKGNPPIVWAYGVASAFLATAYVYPKALSVPNRLWFKFGLLLHKIVNPLVMGFIFYVCVTPMGLVMRAMGKEFFACVPEKSKQSYWKERNPADTPPETLKNQF